VYGAEPELEFEYEFLPAVAVIFTSSETGASTEAQAIVDTGAEGMLLDTTIADDLGVNLVLAPPIQIGRVGGILSEARVAEVQISSPGHSDIRAVVRAAFAPNVATDYGNLLGLDFLASIDSALSHNTRLGYLGKAEA